jgi:hypothetical protein
VAYGHGTKIEVYFPAVSTDVVSKVDVEFQIALGETLHVPLFNVNTPLQFPEKGPDPISSSNGR